MISSVSISLMVLLLFTFQPDSFKDDQLKYERVRQAYDDKESSMLSLLQNKQIEKDRSRIYLRAFKQEKEIELWGKNVSDEKYTLIKVYKVCKTSGNLGPKRQQGDLQIPEGFYHINRFNPMSNFYLSLGINYPNRSDRILGVKENIGGDIFIHGACETIGCLPITNDQIKELYIFCVEARNNGQSNIPVTIFPSKLTETKFERLKDKYNTDTEKIGLWSDLKKGYEFFNETKQLPTIGFLDSGRHDVYE